MQLLKERSFQQSSKLKPQIVNNHVDVELKSSADPDPTALTNFFKLGYPLKFDNPKNDIFLSIYFKNTTEFKRKSNV